jgi:small subunit ribosomal protein S17
MMTQGNEQAVNPLARRERRRQVGTVVSDVRDKTITVVVEFQVEHSRYGKQMKRRTRLQVHDPANQAHVGDRVEIMECRPISKTKSWRLEKVLTTAAGSAASSQ